jgi:hypothetical protein
MRTTLVSSVHFPVLRAEKTTSSTLFLQESVIDLPTMLLFAMPLKAQASGLELGGGKPAFSR